MSELRRDPITGRWVILSPERTRRARDFTPPDTRAVAPGVCPFCEGSEALAGRELLAWRHNGSAPNTGGWDVRVVPNREPALRVEAELGPPVGGLFERFGNLGAHEVIIESPHHDQNWSTLPAEAIGRVLWAWRERIRDLRRDVRLKGFVVVKNHGAAAGAKLDHAHSQLMAYPFAPPALDLELSAARRHYDNAERCVFCDLVNQEIALNQRVIRADNDTVVLAPFAPRVPFETWLLPRAHSARFDDSSDALFESVARALKDLMQRLDAALLHPPFNLVLHTAPEEKRATDVFHWHLEMVPRLGPSSGVHWGSGVYVNPVPPEEAADVLRSARV